MRKSILSGVLTVLLVLILVLSGLAFARWNRAFQAVKVEAKSLRAERDDLLFRLKAADARVAEAEARSASTTPTADAPREDTVALEAVRPKVTTDSKGRKSYFFDELYGANNRVIGREAQFEELLGFTKLAFRTSEGTRYYDLDDLHPEVVRSLGYDAAVLKRRLAEDGRHRQILGAQAKLQAELRTKAAQEFAEREKAAAERAKAEAALRDAEARERLAEAAERAATNPPPRPQRITQKIIVRMPPEQPKFIVPQVQ